MNQARRALLISLVAVAGCDGSSPVSADVVEAADAASTSAPDAADDLLGPDVEDAAAPDAFSWLDREPREGAQPYLLFIGVDGVRGDAFVAADTPTFDRLLASGSWTAAGTTQLSTTTDSSAGWTAIVTGVESTLSGVTDNSSLLSRDWAYPTFSKILNQTLGATIVAAVHWLPFIGGIHEQRLVQSLSTGTDDEVSAAMAERLGGDEGAVFLVHFDDVDHEGHATGFSPENGAYVEAIERIDGYVLPMIEAISARPTIADEDWLVVLVSDHGGDASGHGALTPECRTIPIGFAGPGQARGALTGLVSQLDVAPTVLDHFGVEVPAWMTGTSR